MSTTGNLSAPEDLVRVFVSYAREDRRWLDPDYRYSLIPFLMESLRRHNVVFWFDKELKPGDEFRQLIESEIDQSQIALLIVSQSFLNSEFIENREMPRIAERARLGKMIVVPVLVEPCDWSEYPFLADRQMVPSSPLIEYTESEPQWAKVRFQILDGLKAQLKRIREAPQSHGQKSQSGATDEVLSASATLSGSHASEAPPAIPETGNALKDNAYPSWQEREPQASEPVLPPELQPQVSAAEQKKARNPLKWIIAIATAAALVIALVLLVNYVRRGKPWTARNSGTSAYLESIFAASDGMHLWAVGDGTILESDDGGATWVVRSGVTTDILTAIFGTSGGQQLWAVGSKGTIVESVDEGANWTARSGFTSESLQSIIGTGDGERLWAAGWNGTMLKSIDRGANWVAVQNGTVIYFNSIFETSDGKHLWAVGDHGAIWESDDSGANWMARNSGSPETLRSIAGTWDGSRLWVAGWNGTVLESDDGGASWTALKSGTESDLYSIFDSKGGSRLWACGDKGTILESVDGGASWKTRNSGTSEILNSIIESSDGRHLWAVGDHGTILESDR